MRTFFPSTHPQLSQPSSKGRHCCLAQRIVLGPWEQPANTPHPLALPRARRKRPSSRCAAEQGDEFTPSHECPQDEAWIAQIYHRAPGGV
jgi:hypothetical protein